ncbi:hypothetical protein RS130_18845 [Paraglaciecola aquimarina]|uniref:TonB C-terminal domain-containing protein n=1 Tax=Paraglaciecola aquimarina TaxID=1235557 RepID=A0ABU3T069_9ALTE|nr:hypothetical protein [Paraglaciecola aquimarina]MDU0355664.1 hypothetical protein [Paraglaciecola aquimarina]
MPRLLTSSSQFTIKYPQSLLRRGIRSAEVELDVLIEESGKVILRGFVHNPYPELAPLVEDLMHKARFTSPKKDGLPVRATFTWPMEFGNS